MIFVKLSNTDKFLTNMVRMPNTPTPWQELMPQLDREIVPKVMSVGQTVNGKYLHWDELRHRIPPDGLTLEQWWLGLKIARQGMKRILPLLNKDKQPFWYGLPDQVLEMLHEIDSKASGKIQASEQVTNPETRDRYIVSSLIEESIRSSQLEGASTTRKVAAKMLRSGRRPISVDEQMILNNYEAMSHVREIVNQDLTPELVLNLHRILTENTLDDPDAAGRLQTTKEDRIVVFDDAKRVELHIPPPAGELRTRMKSMCKFANNETKSDFFVHPVIRAIVIHFWLAYDHPFCDGNGRTARTLFYWSMLSQGYWLFDYVSISSILKNAPAKYSRSFLHSETDDNDLTYFIIYQLNVILRAIESLETYLKSKIDEVKKLESSLKQTPGFNHRQIALLSHAVRHPDSEYTVKSHRRSQNISNGTARSDLFTLVKLGLLEAFRIGGKTLVFTVPEDLEARLISVTGPTKKRRQSVLFE